MAAYVQSQVAFDTNAGNKTPVITPALSAYLLVWAAHSGITASPTITDDQTGTYTEVKKCLRSASASYGSWFVRDQFVASAVAHTLTVVPGAVDTGGGGVVIEISGMGLAGTAGIRQSQNADNISPAAQPATVSFAAAALSANLVLAAMTAAANPAGVTEPSTFTERQDIGYATPSAGVEIATVDSGFSGTAVTWQTASTGNVGVAIIELDTTVVATSSALRFQYTDYDISYG